MAKKISERSDRSREKWADSLMNSGTTIASAYVVTIFVSPFTALIIVFLSRGELPALTEPKLYTLMIWVQAWALLLLPIALILSIWLRNKAMDIYDGLVEKEQTQERKARLTRRSSGTKKRCAPY